LGDGSLLVRELALGAESPENRAPLSLFLIQQVYKLIGDVLTTYRAVSLLSGLCFVWLVYRFARELSEDAGSRFWVAALLLSQGYFVLFAGYVETYSLLFAASALYVYVAIRCVSGAVAPLYPAIVLSFAICVHVAAISLVPSLFALVYVRRDQLEPRVIGSIAIMPVLVIGLLLLLDYPFSGGDEGLLVSQHLLPIWSVGTMTVAYALLDGPHLADIANALFLAAPAFVVGIPLVIGRRNWDRLDLWLGTLCIPPLLMTWVINPEIGAFRDWDILAYPALFLTVALGRWVSNPTSRSRRDMVLLVGVSVLHLAPWARVNANEEMAVLRFRTLLETTSLTARGEAYGWDSLGTLYRESDRQAEAYAVYLKALSIVPEHARMQRAAGHAAGELGRFDDAVRHFEAAMLTIVDDDTLVTNYAKALLKAGRYTDASTRFREVLAGDPGQADVERLLALAVFRDGNYDEALELAEGIAAKYPPGKVEDHVMAGSIYGLRRKSAAAIHAFDQALAIDPGNVDALNRLGSVYLAVNKPAVSLDVFGRIPGARRSAGVLRSFGLSHYQMEAFDSAAVYYQQALRLDTNNAELYYRLGSAKLAAGDAEGSVASLRRAIELDAGNAGAYRNLATAFAELDRYDDAKATFTQLLKLNPDVPDRDVLLDWIRSH
jgi:tetratricopeptide (TPR) repeat protein